MLLIFFRFFIGDGFIVFIDIDFVFVFIVIRFGIDLVIVFVVGMGFIVMRY